MLAAPDLDVDVFGQRFWLENLGAVANRTVIYFSDEDKAIALSDWLFSSRTRIGTIGRLKFARQQIALIQQITKLQMVQCDVSGFSSSHAYVFGNPAAMSDVVAVLRDRRDAGAENGRPLKRLDNGFWLLTNDYFAGAGNASASAAK
jgi:esterase/lipase superfamily enzyme